MLATKKNKFCKALLSDIERLNGFRRISYFIRNTLRIMVRGGSQILKQLGEKTNCSEVMDLG